MDYKKLSIVLIVVIVVLVVGFTVNYFTQESGEEDLDSEDNESDGTGIDDLFGEPDDDIRPPSLPT